MARARGIAAAESGVYAGPCEAPAEPGMIVPVPERATTGDAPLIPLELIVPSSTNPRRDVGAGIEELVESVRAHGVLQPILLRPFDGCGFKIVAGHRRFEAAKRAGFLSIPAVVRELTDEEALELQVIENLQRSDLHPLEEAEGYRQLMATQHYDVTRIAERIGRSIKYIYDRVKLLSLTERAQRLFLDGRITAGHAVILARLRPFDQERCIGGYNGKHLTPGPLFQVERGLWDPDVEEPGGRFDRKEMDPFEDQKPISVRELQGWVDQHVRFNPGAPDVPDLFPENGNWEAGPCQAP